jgi:hypothetical protein
MTFHRLPDLLGSIVLLSLQRLPAVHKHKKGCRAPAACTNVRSSGVQHPSACLSPCCWCRCCCRLRQAVDHPYLVVHSNTASTAAADAAEDAAAAATAAAADAADAADVDAVGTSQQQQQQVQGRGLSCADDGSCGLCHDPREDEVAAACGHSFCRSCVAEFIDSVDRVSEVGFVSLVSLGACMCGVISMECM